MMRFETSLCIAILAASTSSAEADTPRPVIAVFDVEARSQLGLEAPVLRLLSDYVATRLAASGLFQSVPRADLKRALLEQKKDSYRACFDEACQIEIGRELAAEKTLATNIDRVGSICIVTMNIYDLARATAEQAATSQGACDDEAIFETVKTTVEQLVSKREMAKPSGPDVGITWIESKPARVLFSKSEVTVGQFRKCVGAAVCIQEFFATTGRTADARCNWGLLDELPMNCVSLEGARQFCKFAGGRLPTIEEWQAEATDKKNRKFPWGKENPGCDQVVMEARGTGACGLKQSAPVCSKSEGNSVSGLCDMSGSLWEWVSDGDAFSAVGGSWRIGISDYMQGDYSRPATGKNKLDDYGFRCVKMLPGSDGGIEAARKLLTRVSVLSLSAAAAAFNKLSPAERRSFRQEWKARMKDSPAARMIYESLPAE